MMIAIFVDNYERALFFKRLAKGLESEVVFITTKLSAHLYLKTEFKCHLLNLIKNDSKLGSGYSFEDIKCFTHVYKKTQSEEHAKKVFNSIFYQCNVIFDDVDVAIVFNGNSASQSAFSYYCKTKEIPTLFCEISNLPGKVLFDIEGVNAKSILYRKPEILDSLDLVSEEFHMKWLSHYKEYKSKPIPQGKLSFKLVTSFILDRLGSGLGFGIREVNTTITEKTVSTLKTIFAKKNTSQEFTYADLTKNYVFFPTQVKHDSQLIVNSDYDNIEALKVAVDIAANRNARLYVKIHPAEEDTSIIKQYLNLKSELGFEIVGNPTNDLIESASHIVVINSTVGLESLLLKKEVTVLGRALYSHLDKDRLMRYVHSYLINFDYFSNEVIDASEVNKLSDLFSVNIK